MSSEPAAVLSRETLNPNIIEMQFGLSGRVHKRLMEIVEEMKTGVKKPFPEILLASYGDCHATGQKPITFIRQVIALCAHPELLKSPDFPDDTKDRARRILENCTGGSIGSYTEGYGLDVVRRHVAAYIAQRDGHACDHNDIVLSSGASDGIRSIISMLLTGKSGVDRAGFMIPIPQYPLYSGSIAEFGACAIPYYLDEKNKWSLNVRELERAIAEAKPKCRPRALVVINPGNPTGSVLSRENMEEVVKFAHRHRLFLMADEVYQHNIWADSLPFVSFKKVLMEMTSPYNTMQMASFMSISKGYTGECGLRGGYAEMVNFDPEVKKEYFKTVHIKLCPPLSGQTVLDCVVNPPQPGEPSYDLFNKEKSELLSSLKEKAKFMSEIFNSIEGISCNEVMGAMYAFPRVHLPEKAVEAARAAGQTPDTFYCLAMLEETGICTAPGCGFGEESGTFHFRITILPKMEALKPALERFKDFHLKFFAKYK